MWLAYIAQKSALKATPENKQKYFEPWQYNWNEISQSNYSGKETFGYTDFYIFGKMSVCLISIYTLAILKSDILLHATWVICPSLWLGDWTVLPEERDKTGARQIKATNVHYGYIWTSVSIIGKHFNFSSFSRF